MRISFDFDSTLSLQIIQDMLKCFDREKVEIFIITSRHRKYDNEDLFQVAEVMNIPEENIFMTDGNYKWSICDQNDIDIHFDDMPDEIMFIQSNSNNTLGVLVTTNIIGDMNFLSLLNTSTFTSKQIGKFE